MPSFSASILPSSLQNRSDRVVFLALAGSISSALVSIAVSQILLAVCALGALAILRRRKGPMLPWVSLVLPLLAFSVWTIIAALLSPNVPLGLTIVKKFYLFLLVPLVPLVLKGEYKASRVYEAIFAVSAFSAAVGVAQFLINPHRDLLHRISGLMSQWMTYSGLLMLVLVVLTAYILADGRRNNKWMFFTLGALLALALILSETRNALMGALAGISVLLSMRRPRAIAGFVGVVIVIYLASPSNIKERFQSGLNPEDPNTRNRIELVQTSIRLIRANPWFGVGPKNVGHEALKYRGSHEYPDWMYQHMHNNFLQIAAETGIPGLLIWLWFMCGLAWGALRVYRSANRGFIHPGALRSQALMASSAALGTWVALLAAGMFEYNFGDSEVLTLFLFIMSAPYAFINRTLTSAMRPPSMLHFSDNGICAGETTARSTTTPGR